MSEPDAELNLLFDEMANETSPPEPASSEARRRQRAIGGMRAMHRSLAEERVREPRRRPQYVWIGLAAALALAGTALAAARGGLPFSLGSRQRLEAAPANHSRPQPTSGTVGGAPPVVAQLEVAPTSAPVVLAPAPAASAPQRSGARSTSGQTAELEEVNRLFVEAKRARREHRDAEALGLLQRLLNQHSGSVLAHEATVERFRALARLGRRDEARRSAQTYLARYPGGFAADEARALVGATP